MDNNQLINYLTILLGFMVGVLIILCVVFLVLKLKNNTKKTKKGTKTQEVTVKSKSTIPQSYTKESIFKFMEFDKIEDNMIIQKDGKRFIMVIECQGVNFDLMSGLEKNSVEQGFLQFLNTLRYPIQIYVQTRTVNLGNSINTYKDRIDNISHQYANKQMEYNQKVRSGQYSNMELQKERLELTRQRNLYEYGIDIVNNTERMSLNKNVLSKHYYIVISHYPEESSDSNFQKEEISNIAFSELYTKSQSIVTSLSVCGIKGKVLNSTELAELLYIAYNRDESEALDLRKTLNAGYQDLYTTAPDVFEKRMKELDLKAEEEAIVKANDTIIKFMEENEKQKKAKRKEQELDNLIDQMAMALIEENRRALGDEITDGSIEKIKEDSAKTKEEGGEEDVKETKAKTKTRRRATV